MTEEKQLRPFVENLTNGTCIPEALSRPGPVSGPISRDHRTMSGTLMVTNEIGLNPTG